MQPKDRILDVYGAFARDLGGWMAISHLIELLASLGVDEQAVRSAASRMKRNDLLISHKVDSVAGYALSPGAAEILQHGDARIFQPVEDHADPAEGWLIAVFSVPESERKQRYAIRSGLTRLGFGQATSAVWIAPDSLHHETCRMFERAALDGYVNLWRADYLGFDDLATVVAEAWALDEIAERYGAYVARFAGVAARWDTSTADPHASHDDAEAFIDYMNGLGAWRPLPYLDPGLPVAVLPDNWPGQAARALFSHIETTLRPAAARHFHSVVGR
jgi:phenylacetic acid degradation operon negative regulatory protein